MAYGFRDDFDCNNRFDLKTKVNGYIVSTVDLGIDHSFGIGKPLYYETMIFKEIDGHIVGSTGYQVRYSTEKEAKIGHKKAIEYVESGTIERENKQVIKDNLLYVMDEVVLETHDDYGKAIIIIKYERIDKDGKTK